MFFILSTLLIFIVSIKIASLIGAILLATFFKLKQRIQGLSDQEWGHYFDSMDTYGLLLRMYIAYFVALTGVAIFNTFLFWHGFFGYGIALILAGLFYTYSRYKQNKDKIRQLFNKKS
ncbi:hypothetical protein CBF34_06645 [Vagococcus penaei]|uniref:Uncharacterized protein n=1 Tax=Vagococcus penaei TaxID=633807 RepID=A0A1Q2D6H2_9ENTE|nr:hypothetical protein [Vagococcus penaei]AQP54039.1 hypothetical protein BW732_07300 [Vagococcus penaei]RSU01728.1 hypothetical protein CBF34_06645 [Vagococcus penaei]